LACGIEAVCLETGKSRRKKKKEKARRHQLDPFWLGWSRGRRGEEEGPGDGGVGDARKKGKKGGKRRAMSLILYYSSLPVLASFWEGKGGLQRYSEKEKRGGKGEGVVVFLLLVVY